MDNFNGKITVKHLLKYAKDGHSMMDTCLKWTDFYALLVCFTYVRWISIIFSMGKERERDRL